LIAPALSLRNAFLVSFLAYALGGLNMWNYFRELIPLPVLLLSVFGPAVVFAAITLAFRAYALRGQLFRAMFSFPLLWVAFQFLQEFRSIHSTFGNLAYTQMNFLPVLQIASMTGIWGIDFLLFLFPSAVALLFLSSNSTQKRNLAIAAGGILAIALGFGVVRLNEAIESRRVTVGLVATDAPSTRFPPSPATLDLVRQYVPHIQSWPSGAHKSS
jgi:apolipoprotein N-acyltransferase